MEIITFKQRNTEPDMEPIVCGEEDGYRTRNIDVPAILLAMALTAAVLSVIYFLFDLYPFGSLTLAWGDMKQQTVPLLLEFKDILEGRADMLLNMQNAGGMSFWGVFFFFLSSPLSFLVLFIEKTEIFYLVNLLVLIKLLLSAGSSAIFFSSEYSEGSHRSITVSLAVSYALCGYGLLYYQNLLWLDLMYLFPLTMYGLRKIMDRGAAGLFCACITMTLVFSYYLSYMVLLAILLICGAYCLNCKGERARELACKVGLSVLLAVGLTAVIWLPSLMQYFQSARVQGILDGLKNSGFFAPILSTLPIIYCTGSLVSISAVELDKERRFLPISFLLLSIPIFIEPINKLWHMGSYQAFPARYGYITVFLGLWLVLEGCKGQKDRNLEPDSPILLMVLLLTVTCGLIMLRFYFEELSSYVLELWVSWESSLYLLPFLILSGIGFFLFFKAYRGSSGRTGAWGLPILLLVLCQGIFFGSIYMGGAANQPQRQLRYLEQGETGDSQLYRVKSGDSNIEVNLTGARGHSTLNHYTSLTDGKYYSAMKKLGYSGYWMEISSYGGTAVSDLILSNRYAALEYGSLAQLNSSSIGVIAPKLPEKLEGEDRLAINEELYRALTGKTGFNFYEAEKLGDRLLFEIYIGRPEIVYLDVFDGVSNKVYESIFDSVSISINGEPFIDSYPTQKNNGILNLGLYESQKLNIELHMKKNISLDRIALAGLKESKLAELEADLSYADAVQQDNGLIFEADGGEEDFLFISVALEGELDIRLDGWRTEYHRVMDCFYQLRLHKGENQVTVSYLPSGFRAGLILSCVFLCLLILAFLFRNSIPGLLLGRAVYFVAHPALMLISAAAFVLVYILPVVICLLPS